MASTCAHIKRKEDLTPENIELIFKRHFNDQSVRVEAVEEEEEEVAPDNPEAVKLVVKINILDSSLKLFAKNSLRIVKKECRPALFMHETFWYQDAVPSLTKVSPELRDITPICFHSHSSFDGNRPMQSWLAKQGTMINKVLGRQDDGFLLLEDLTDPHRRGGSFKMMNKMSMPSLEEAELVMKTMAKFHGIWLAWFCNQNPKQIGSMNKESILENFAWPKPGRRTSYKGLRFLKTVERLLIALEKPKDVIDAFSNYRRTKALDDLYKNYFCHPTHSSLVSMTHGDFWSSNLFCNESATKLMVIDFQGIAPNHIAKDFWYYIVTCTDSTWRKDHLEHCLLVYYQTFETYLTKAGLHIPYEEFKSQTMEWRSFGFYIQMIIMPILLHPFPVKLETKQDYKTINEWRNEHYSKPHAEDENEDIKEIHRRLIDAVEEAYTLGIL